MNKAAILCILGLAAVAMAEVKVTGYSSSSSSVLSPTGKIFISTILTPAAAETSPAVEEPVFVLPNRTSHRPSPVEPVISPIAPVPIAVLPWVEASKPEKPTIGVYPIIRPGLPESIEPEFPVNPIDQRPSIDLPVEAEKPAIGVYPIIRPGLPHEEPEAAVRPIVGKPIVFPVVQPENKLPVVEKPQGPSVLPVIQPGNKLPVVEAAKPEIRPIAPQPVVRPIYPEISVMPVVQPEIRPIAPQPVVTPIVAPEIRPIAPQPVISPIAQGPSIMPAVGGEYIPAYSGALIR